jgi:hypothetical protein
MAVSHVFCLSQEHVEVAILRWLTWIELVEASIYGLGKLNQRSARLIVK